MTMTDLVILLEMRHLFHVLNVVHSVQHLESVRHRLAVGLLD